MYNSSFPQKRIRVLVVDDSSFMRVAIRSILAKDPGIEIVGTAIDGIEAVEKAVALKPDIITLDVEMPRLDGIGALKKIMVAAPTRVIMVSTLTSEGAKATFDALDAGAIDYISKNVTDCSEAQAVFREELVRKVKGGAVSLLTAQKPRVRPQVLRKPLALSRERIAGIAIGASTGARLHCRRSCRVSLLHFLMASWLAFICPRLLPVLLQKD